MVIQCPYCKNPIALKSAKPGRYGTRCPRCAEQFQLRIPEDPSGTPEVKPLPAEAAGVGLPAAPADGQGTGARDRNAAAAASAGNEDPGGAAGPAPEPAPPGPGSAGYGFRVGGLGQRPAGVPALLGGYHVLQELRKGGVGAVYLARPMPLIQNVALEVLKPEWARNPTFVWRFTREAYAAAQLAHDNIVPIYELGVDRGVPFVSMEFVPGGSLADLLRRQRMLDPEVAAGYVLQAARGLKYAHEQGLIHRDIKPENLVLDDQEVVKVAELGLVKTPTVAEAEAAAERGKAAVQPPARSAPAVGGGPATVVNVAVGTPAFMAPEQARDALGADARADIYSLGCTLYALVTGRPPFEGQTAVELIAKHENEPIVPPERLVPAVPKELSEIIMRMVAKRPEERYPNLGEVIRALEGYLGVPSTGLFSPRAEDARVLEDSARRFNASATARLRTTVWLGGAGAWALVVLLSLLAGQFRVAVGFFGLGAMTALGYFIIDGVTRKSYLFRKTCELIFGGGASDWLIIAAGVLLLLGLVVVFQMFWAMLAFAIVAVVIAWGIHTVLDRRAETERREPVEQVARMIRGLRRKGLDEETLRQFVCRYAGNRWEELYEALFGYEAKLVARARWGRDERGRLRPRFALWRDPLVRAIEAKQDARRAVSERKLLQRIEEKGLEAQGINLLTARRRAHRVADAMVATAAEVRASARAADVQGGERLSIGKALKHAAERPEDVLAEQEAGPARFRLEGPLNLALGAKTRFLVGAALMAGCLVWMDQNKILDTERIKATAAELQKAAQKARESNDVGEVLDVKVDAAKHVRREAIHQAHDPLALPGLPGTVGGLFNSFNPGVAGLILIVSSWFRGWRLSLFVLPGAAITLLGPSVLGVPSSQPFDLRNLVTMALGGVLLLVGCVLGRTR